MKRIKNQMWKIEPPSVYQEKEYWKVVRSFFYVNESYEKANGTTHDVPNMMWLVTNGETYLSAPNSLAEKFSKALRDDFDLGESDNPLKEESTTLGEGKWFSLQGNDQSLNPNGDAKWLREILTFDESITITVRVRECIDQKKVREQIQFPNGISKKEKVIAKIKPAATTVFNHVLDAMWEQKDIDKMKSVFSKFKGKKKEAEAEPSPHPLTTRQKLHFKSRYVEAQILFHVTDRVEEFKTFLQEKIQFLQGENSLKVVECEPNLELLQKGHIEYDLPTLVLYQKELARFILLPASADELMEEQEALEEVEEKKAELPDSVYIEEAGAIPFARHLETNGVIHLPKAVSKSDLDDRVKPTLLVGEQGSGKTTAIVNNILETFFAGAKDKEEWKKYARSCVSFDVADGAIIAEVLQHIPPWLMDRVKILNHSDTKNPIPVSLNDLTKMGANPAGIAELETKMLLDCLNDDSKTIAMERYFKHALQASYAIANGNILDAMHILISPSYREEVIQKLEHKDGYLYVELLEIHRELEDDKVTLKTIENRIAQYRTDSSLMEVIAQEPSDEINFWRWMNGDEGGAYLVLIYLPKGGDTISEACRNFLFTHYYVKIWKLMLARESMDVNRRPETLVIVDEIHQVLGQRAVQSIFGDIFKEPRKYRIRYMFTFHGWSSIEEAGKKKESIIKSMKEAGCNLFLLKGGDEFFKSLSGMLSPYTADDFNELMGMKYCGIFRFAVNKQNHVIQAKLLEPAEMRMAKYRNVTLEDLRNNPNALGRPVELVKKRIFDKLKGMYENRPKKKKGKKQQEAEVLEF